MTYEKFEFDFARNSLKYLIKRFRIQELYIPYYLCDVIRHAVIAENCKPLFYHIDDEFYPAQEFPENSYILYPNYFGICDGNVNRLEKIYPNLIVDNAHSFYSPPQGFACFNSARKFLPVENGSVLWVKTDEEEKVSEDVPFCCPVARTEKFRILYEEFKNKNQLKIDINSARSPFCYPYLAVSDYEADEVAERFINQGLTIYRYWKNLPQNYNEYKFYRRLVPIPID